MQWLVPTWCPEEMRFSCDRFLRAGLLLAVLAGAACTAQPMVDGAARSKATTMSVWLTQPDSHFRMQLQSPAAHPAAALSVAVQIDPARRMQSIVGFGASVTDASGGLLQTHLSDSARASLLRELFGRSDDGLGLSLTRLTIGASDFSRTHYSLDEPPDGMPDPTLAHYSVARNQADVIPVMQQALAINPQLRVMASPWSPPAWMKSSGSLIGGTLLPEYEPALAHYLLHYVDAYAAHGVPIWALTLQNEPGFEPANYPGMRMPAEQRARVIARHLGPLLATRYPRPLIFDWDHNWDEPQEPMQVLADVSAAPHVAGVAWHCYGGKVAAQSDIHDAHPDKLAILSECSGGDWEPVRSGGLLWLTRNVILDAIRHWASGVVLWNLALDQDNGPHLGGCGTCRGVVTIDTRDGTITRNDEYWALAHFSRFVHPGAVRIASVGEFDGLHHVAFANTADGSIVLVAVNERHEALALTVQIAGARYVVSLPERSIATVRWSKPQLHPDRSH